MPNSLFRFRTSLRDRQTPLLIGATPFLSRKTPWLIPEFDFLIAETPRLTQNVHF
jgi:hypothetical protein